MSILPTLSCNIETLEKRLLFAVGGPYSVPVNPQTSLNLDPGWKFALYTSGSNASLASPTFNASSWTNVTLPHTWDASSTNDQTGDGWYRQTITVPSSMSGDEIYLQFQGASLSATVYVDGVSVGTHNGGWEAFDVDVTASMTPGSHLLAVDVNNNTNSNVVPAGGGDYTKQGGLYRSVSLLAVSKTHVALTEPVLASDTSGSLVAGSGVYFSNSAVALGIASANVQVQTVLDNLSGSPVPLTVTSFLVDAAGIIRAQQASSVTLTTGQTDASVFQNATVFSPHLWNGLADPYLYDLYVQISDTASGQLMDLNHQQVGIRSFRIDPNTGFYLNGMPYKLVGVNMHQDSSVPGQNGGIAGWAQTDAQQDNDLNMALAMGVTIIRTSHYQRDAAFYSYCDQTGLIIETETGINGPITSTTPGSAFANNAEDALTEMIRQNYNHPSIIFWSMYNEISSNTNNATFVSTLSTLAHTLDQTGRDTIVETDSGGPTDGINDSTDAANFHNYNGWYGGNPANTAGSLASTHAASSIPMGVGEFGAGASAYQFTTNITIPIANTNAVYHPENEQAAVIEAQYAAISSQPYLLDIIDWVMFDFSSSGRHEGDTAGINDKGLVTRDRTTYKDAYYFYQANWNNPTSARGYNTTPVIWISDHSWTDRQGTSTVPVTVFSNVGAPTLTLNGGAPITLTPQVVSGLTIPDAYSANVSLAAGSNNLVVSGKVNGHTYTNSVLWTYHAAALTGTTYAKVEFTSSSSNLQSGYAADTGQALAAQSNGATYGWTDLNANPLANTSGTYDRTGNTASPYNVLSAQTGIIVNPINQWQYQLPNGTYDVEIVGADSSTSNIVDNLSLNGTLLHATSFSTSGGTYQAFYDTVTVTNGKLTVSGGLGMVLSNGGVPTTQGRLSSIIINAINSPAVVSTGTTIAGTSGNDDIRLVRSGLNLLAYVDSSVPTYTFPYALLNEISIAGGGGTDTINIDFSGGSTPVPSGGLMIDGTNGTDTLIVTGTSGNDVASINANTISFNGSAITYQFVESIIIDGNGGADSLTQTAQPGGFATLAFNGATVGGPSAGDNLNVSAGNFTFNAPAANSGVEPIHLSTLSIGPTAGVSLAIAGTRSDRWVLTLGTLIMAGSNSRLDLGDSDMIVLAPGSLPGLMTAVAEGYNGGMWTGAGISSSAAHADTTHLAALAVMQNSNGSLFDNQAVDNGDVIVKFTYVGDANLDGKVDGSDYSRIDNGYATRATTWFNGDFNYDGVVDGSDYALIDNAFNMQGAALTASADAEIVTTMARDKRNARSKSQLLPQTLFHSQAPVVFPLLQPASVEVSLETKDVLDRQSAFAPDFV